MVGADVVEVAPAYDGPGEQTALTAAQVGYEILTSWVRKGLTDIGEVEKSGISSAEQKNKDEL